MKVVAYLPAKHAPSCLSHGDGCLCNCGAEPIPLVLLREAEAAYDDVVNRAIKVFADIAKGETKQTELECQALNKRSSDASNEVLAERMRQISCEGWSAERDDKYKSGELAGAAACYAQHVNERSWIIGTYIEDYYASAAAPDGWPWDDAWWKPTTPRRDLIKAGALILAEMERLDRACGAQLKH